MEEEKVLEVWLTCLKESKYLIEVFRLLIKKKIFLQKSEFQVRKSKEVWMIKLDVYILK